MSYDTRVRKLRVCVLNHTCFWLSRAGVGHRLSILAMILSANVIASRMADSNVAAACHPNGSVSD